MVMARIFREYRNTVVNYKQFPSHLRKKKYFPCDRNVSLCTVLTFGLRKFKQRNFFLASLVVETGKTCPGIAAYSTFQNRNRRGQCKVLLPLIKKPHLEKTQKHISSHCLTNLCMFNETKESKN